MLVLVVVSVQLLTRASNDRDWTVDQAVLPAVDFSGDQVTVHNIRNFDYASTTSYTPRYYDATFDLDDVEAVYFVVEPFSGYVGAAHTFLSFEFKDDRFLAISVEIRKEQGESFSALKGLLNQYELMYVIADERDVIKLRSNHRKDDVYVYPIRAEKERIHQVFVDMLERAESLRHEPMFYNTLTNTCTTNIISHVNKITPDKIPFDYRILFPADSDELAYELGLIEGAEETLEQTRAKYRINTLAERYADDPQFSLRIRGR